MHASELSVVPQTAATALTTHDEPVGHWAMERDIQISDPKSQLSPLIP